MKIQILIAAGALLPVLTASADPAPATTQTIIRPSRVRSAVTVRTRAASVTTPSPVILRRSVSQPVQLVQPGQLVQPVVARQVLQAQVERRKNADEKKEVVETETRIVNPDPEILNRVNEFYNLDFGPSKDVSVKLDLDNVPVRDAVKQICDQAKLEYVVDEDVSEDARITVRADKIKLSTALSLVAEAADVRWGHEIRDNKRRVRIGKKVGSNLSGVLLRRGQGNQFRIAPQFFPGDNRFTFNVDPQVAGGVSQYFRGFGEERSTFNCPHCKGQTTMIRVRQQPKCTKCSRMFERDWQFCPVDGSKRPAAPNEWKHCPLCGKEVSRERSSIQKIPILGDLPIIGSLFRNEVRIGPDPDAGNGPRPVVPPTELPSPTDTLPPGELSPDGGQPVTAPVEGGSR